jgi:hypothetical protein
MIGEFLMWVGRQDAALVMAVVAVVGIWFAVSIVRNPYSW